MRNVLRSILCTVFFAQGSAYAQPYSHEAGRPFIRNYNPKDYAAQPSNWAIVQDQRGVMYFGNAEGILEYDGVAWRRISTPNKTVVRSLALGQDGRIYVGEVGQFGYLAPDSLSRMRFISLVDSVPAAQSAFADVWSVRANSQGVYFTTYNTLFRWADSRIRTWPARERFQLSFVVREAFYVDQKGVGLMQMVGDALQLLPGGETFADKRIYALLPFDDRRLLIGTMGHGLFLYDGMSFLPFKTAVDKFLGENQLYYGALLPDGTFALATIRGGVVIIDKQGKLLQKLNKTTGLQDNFVLSLYADNQNGLWLALFNGITRVETPSPLSVYSDASGLKGGVVAIRRHRGTLYVATGLGVYTLQAGGANGAAFQPVPGIATQCWSFLEFGPSLLTATNNGVYEINGPQATSLGLNGAAVLYRSGRDSNRIYVGRTFGLATLRKQGGRWLVQEKLPGIDEEIRSIVEEPDGSLWLGTKSQGILRVEFASAGSGTATAPAAKIEKFSIQQGLPEGEIAVYRLDTQTFFASNVGLLGYDEHERRFHPDSSLGAAFADGTTGVGVLAEDHRGTIWLVANTAHGDEINGLRRTADGSYHRLRTPLLRVPKTAMWALYPESDGVLWFGGADGLVRYDQRVRKDYAADYAALIRRVTVNYDSLVFGGTQENGNMAHHRYFDPTLKYADNALRFEYSASSFDDESANQFQTLLQGFDKNWSAWTRESKKDYTNLSEGAYHFRVRARNVYEQLSQEAVFNFTILPPWYRSRLAYTLYVLLLIGAIFVVDRVQRQRLLQKEHARAEIREAKLRAEAAELRSKILEAENVFNELELKKAKELEQAYRALTEAHAHLQMTQEQLVQSEKMASLGQLTAGIAHEIKNPLNFVNNFADLSVELMNEIRENFEIEKANMDPERAKDLATALQELEQNARKIKEHGNRADSIVRSMMLHSRGGSGEREITDINHLLDQAVTLAYHGMRAQDVSFNTAIEKSYDESLEHLEVISQDLSRVFLNIVNNACYALHTKKKATTAPFAPVLAVRTKNLADHVEIRIRDNGDGIPPAVRDKIFDPFFTTKPAGKGTGLGLSISYEIIVQRHQGELSVESAEGSFTEFVIRLPKKISAS